MKFSLGMDGAKCEQIMALVLAGLPTTTTCVYIHLPEAEGGVNICIYTYFLCIKVYQWQRSNMLYTQVNG